MQYKNLFIILLLVLYPVFSQAQQLKMYEGNVNYENKTYPCLTIEMEAPSKETKKAWEDFLKDEYDIKLRGLGFLTNKDVLYAEGIQVPEISDKTMDFFTRIVTEKGTTTMQVFGSFGYSYPISPRDFPLAFNSIKRITKNWLDAYLIDYYQDDVVATQELVSELRSDTGDLRNEIEENKSEIEKLNQEIADFRKEVAQKEKDLADALLKLSEKERELEMVGKKLKKMDQKN